MDARQSKVEWRGMIVSIQPRSTVWRYVLDNRTHRECGFNVFLKGTVKTGDILCFSEGKTAYDFCVAISEKQEQKYKLHIGDEVQGTAWTVMYPQAEFADYYRAGAIKKLNQADPMSVVVPEVVLDADHPRYDGTAIPRVDSENYPGPPWTFEPPALEIYAWRGARLLSKACWSKKCFTCVWANMANVTIEYNFNTNSVRNRFEAFCYGPLSCKYYKMGPARAVPYYQMSGLKDDGCLDEICVEYRYSEDE